MSDTHAIAARARDRDRVRTRTTARIAALLVGIVGLPGGGGCKDRSRRTSRPSPSEAKRVLERVFPADLDGDGESELIAVLRSPAKKRSLMEAIGVRTGKRLWSQDAVPVQPDSLLRYQRWETVDSSRLLVTGTVNEDEPTEQTAVALYRLRDGHKVWSRRLPGTVGGPGRILHLHGPRVLVTTQRKDVRHLESKLYVLAARDGSERCSVTLKHSLHASVPVGKWLLVRHSYAKGPARLGVVSLTDCTVRDAGMVNADPQFAQDGRILVFTPPRVHASRLTLHRFDAASGRLVALEPHPDLVAWGRDESHLSIQPGGLLRQHRPRRAGGSHRLTLYAGPQYRKTRWAVPIPGAPGWALEWGSSPASALSSVRAQSPKTGLLKARRLKTGPLKTGPLKTGPLKTGPLKTGPLKTGPRYLPIVLTHRQQHQHSTEQRRLAILDLRTGHLCWQSKPIHTVDSPWKVFISASGNARARPFWVIRHTQGGRKSPGLLWVLDGTTGKTLHVLQSPGRFGSRHLWGEWLFGVSVASNQAAAAPFVYDLRNRKLLLGKDPEKRLASKRARLERDLGPLP